MDPSDDSVDMVRLQDGLNSSGEGENETEAYDQEEQISLLFDQIKDKAKELNKKESDHVDSTITNKIMDMKCRDVDLSLKGQGFEEKENVPKDTPKQDSVSTDTSQVDEEDLSLVMNPDKGKLTANGAEKVNSRSDLPEEKVPQDTPKGDDDVNAIQAKQCEPQSDLPAEKVPQDTATRDDVSPDTDEDISFLMNPDKGKLTATGAEMVNSQSDLPEEKVPQDTPKGDDDVNAIQAEQCEPQSDLPAEKVPQDTATRDDVSPDTDEEDISFLMNPDKGKVNAIEADMVKPQSDVVEEDTAMRGDVDASQADVDTSQTVEEDFSFLMNPDKGKANAAEAENVPVFANRPADATVEVEPLSDQSKVRRSSRKSKRGDRSKQKNSPEPSTSPQDAAEVSVSTSVPEQQVLSYQRAAFDLSNVPMFMEDGHDTEADLRALQVRTDVADTVAKAKLEKAKNNPTVGAFLDTGALTVIDDEPEANTSEPHARAAVILDPSIFSVFLPPDGDIPTLALKSPEISVRDQEIQQEYIQRRLALEQRQEKNARKKERARIREARKEVGKKVCPNCKFYIKNAGPDICLNDPNTYSSYPKFACPRCYWKPLYDLRGEVTVGEEE
eukprot:g47568.t1